MTRTPAVQPSRDTPHDATPWHAHAADEVLRLLQSGRGGLAAEEARRMSNAAMKRA